MFCGVLGFYQIKIKKLKKIYRPKGVLSRSALGRC